MQPNEISLIVVAILATLAAIFLSIGIISLFAGKPNWSCLGVGLSLLMVLVVLCQVAEMVKHSL